MSQRTPLRNRLRLRPATPPAAVRDVQPAPTSLWRMQRMQLPHTRLSGVVHVGAHLGEELEAYLAAGYRRIVLVEANPNLMPRLTAHCRFWSDWMAAVAAAYGITTVPRIQCVHAAATDHDGQARLLLTQHSLQSSLLAPATPGIEALGSVTVPARRLDPLLEELGIAPESIGLLAADIQGAEHRMLAGAPRLLAHADAVIAEYAVSERYTGQATRRQLDAMLAAHGLAADPDPPSDYDIRDAVYRRRPPGPPRRKAAESAPKEAVSSAGHTGQFSL